MALRTKNAIRRSFIELLAERPFDKISLRCDRKPGKYRSSMKLRRMAFLVRRAMGGFLPFSIR